VPEAQLVAEDPVAFVRSLKEGPGKDIWLVGGGEIVTLLHDAGLIDAYILALIPVILGDGIELFPAVKARPTSAYRAPRILQRRGNALSGKGG
jgi:dihydrofolate reductase